MREVIMTCMMTTMSMSVDGIGGRGMRATVNATSADECRPWHVEPRIVDGIIMLLTLSAVACGATDCVTNRRTELFVIQAAAVAYGATECR